MTKIHIIQTGGTLVSPAVPNKAARKSPIAFTGLFQRRSNRIEVPVKSFLVEQNGRHVLVDTGWAEACAEDARKHLGFGLWFASEPVFKHGQGVAAQLDNLGIAPSDLDAIVMTHLDCDHASGLCDVKDAKAFYVTKEELHAANKGGMRYRPAFWKGIPFTEMNMTFDENSPFERSCDLFGDGTFICHFTHTHSPGSICIEVRNPQTDRFALITGDNSYNRHSWEEGKLPGIVIDEDKFRRVLGWIDGKAEDERCAAVLATHDPEVAPGVIEV